MAQPIRKIMLNNENFSKELTYLLDYITNEMDAEKKFSEITPELFVLSALEEKGMLYRTVNTYLTNSSIDGIHDKLYEYSERKEKEKNPAGNIGSIPLKYSRPKLSAELKHFFTEAQNELNSENSLLTSDLVLLSILKEENYITDLFKVEGVTYTSLKRLSKGVHEVVEEINSKESNNSEEKKETGEQPKENINFKIEEISDFPFGKVVKITGNIDPNNINIADILGQNFKQPTKRTSKKADIPFCTDLNEQCEKGLFDNLIGRTTEMEEIFRVLARRKSNNVILVGESGVGKSQIVNGLVNLIVKNEAPLQFRGKRVFRFNPGEAISGTSLRGQFEEHIMEMIDALHKDKNVILFIDDMHTIFSDRTKNEYDSGGVISQLFSDPEVQIIAATQDKGYKTINDSNPDVVKLFQKVNIDPTNEDDAITILKGIKDKYEKFHNVIYSDEILKECVLLSKKYITEKSLPSSAIDIMDEVGSYRKLNDERILKIKELSKTKESYEEKLNSLMGDKNYDDISKTKNSLEGVKKEIAIIEGEYRDSEPMVISIEDLFKTISLHTGIPVGKVKSDDKKALSEINSKLKEVIVGQDEAIDVISRAIKRNKIGFSAHTRPVGAFFFVGESGVGKTILAKTLAKEIFGDEKYLIRFDMSEYVDQTSVNKLIGSSAGYVGYNEGGLLTEAVKKQKYAVLLIDEIEKANEQVYNLFLQVLDEGYLNDNMGQKVDFRNTIVILTSNVGTKKANQTHAFGFNPDEDANKKDIIEKELKKKFPPEFINRLDSIVYFNRLTDDNLKDIIKLELKKTVKKIEDIGHHIEYNQDVIENIFGIIAKEREYGARPIIRTICNEIENPITDLLIENDYENHTFAVVVNNEKIEIR